jgi:sialidase-1
MNKQQYLDLCRHRLLTSWGLMCRVVYGVTLVAISPTALAQVPNGIPANGPHRWLGGEELELSDHQALDDHERQAHFQTLPQRWEGVLEADQPLASSDTSHEDPRIKRVIVRREGDDGSKSYRIPAMTVTPKGTIVTCFDIRWNGSGDLPANIDVGVMRSTDNGDTWGPMIIAMDYDQNVANSRDNGVGDPAILVDRDSGHLFIAALWSFGDNGWHGSRPGLDFMETGQLVIARSTDDGLTWERPRSITPQIKDPSWRLLFNGPGAGIQLIDGTLVFPAQFKDAEAKPSSCFIYSTDQGENWKISPAAIPDTPLTSESQIVQLGDGSLLMTMRNETRDPQRAWSRWEWTGELANGRWVDTRLDVTDPVCMAGLTRHPSGVVLLSNNNSNRRERMTIRYSRDEGQTWSKGRLLDPRPAAYSCLATLANGEVGILYECGDSGSVETLTFARFPLEWVTEEKPK